MTPIKNSPVSKVQNLTPIEQTFKTSNIAQSSLSSSKTSSCGLIQCLKNLFNSICQFFKDLCCSSSEEEKPYGNKEIIILPEEDISPEEFAQLLKQNPYVEKLTIISNILTAKDFSGIANLKNLKELRVRVFDSFSPSLQFLYKENNSQTVALPIETLTTSVHKKDFHHLQQLDKTLKVLVLSLNGCDDDFFQQEPNPFSFFPNLETLSLINCRLHKEESYNALAATVRDCMPHIEKIQLQACHGFRGQSLDTFAKIPSLKELKIIGAKNIVDQWVNDFRKDRPDVDLILQFS